ncbi:MAG TPA: gluconokinase [Alphaproteobacteria bacterium]|nr:gluconokinase [Alphaproteobacteria bacterium]
MEPMESGWGRVDALVVMGVSGCGKSEVARRIAAALGWAFVEGDSFHPAENIARMAAGQPLTDEHRWGWLAAIAEQIAKAGGGGAVVACSALKRRYRDRLREAGPLAFVHLDGDRETLRRRMEGRQGHFMPASLLDSQLAALEPPGPDESAIRCDIRQSPDEIAAAAIARLRRAGALPADRATA